MRDPVGRLRDEQTVGHDRRGARTEHRGDRCKPRPPARPVRASTLVADARCRGRDVLLDAGGRPGCPARPRTVRRRRALRQRVAGDRRRPAPRLAPAVRAAGAWTRRSGDSEDPCARPAGRPHRPRCRFLADATASRASRHTAHGVRSTLPDGVYRIQVTAADIRAAGAQGLGGVWPAVETLTLRDGHWRLDFTEPTIDAEYGTYAGTPLAYGLVDRPGRPNRGVVLLGRRQPRRAALLRRPVLG